ncbi:MAG: tetratricopeptide repeat protein [Planctomycetes bacterium]|nr:tetratricopeptide repeat protein [Planctomycetota bacterium]
MNVGRSLWIARLLVVGTAAAALPLADAARAGDKPNDTASGKPAGKPAPSRPANSAQGSGKPSGGAPQGSGRPASGGGGSQGSGKPSGGGSQGSGRPATPPATPPPSSRPATPPPAKPATPPATKPASKPASRPATAPVTRPATPPAAKPATPPTPRPVPRPESRPESRRETPPETRPATRPAVRPATRPETAPATEPVTPPTARRHEVDPPARRAPSPPLPSRGGADDGADRGADRLVPTSPESESRERARRRSQLEELRDRRGEVRRDEARGTPPRRDGTSRDGTNRAETGRHEARPADPIVSIPERSPRFQPVVRRLPRDTVPPNRGTPPTVPPSTPPPTEIDVDVDVDVHVDGDGHARGYGGHGGRHHDVDVAFYFGDPCNRQPCWTDPCGIRYGYVFCGSSLWWYRWSPGCDPYFTPYYYYWSPSCYWLPSYYPTYATVYYVREEVVLPSDAASVAGPPVPGVDAAQLLADGHALFTAGDYGGALDAYRQAVLALPDEPFAKLAMAQALFAIGNYGDAAFLLRRVGELLPDWPVVGEDPRGRYADPLDHFEQMVALRAFLDRIPGEPSATLVLALQSYFTGDLAVARDAFAELAALDPADPLPRRFLDRLGPSPAPLAPAPAPLDPDGR